MTTSNVLPLGLPETIEDWLDCLLNDDDREFWEQYAADYARAAGAEKDAVIAHERWLREQAENRCRAVEDQREALRSEVERLDAEARQHLRQATRNGAAALAAEADAERLRAEVDEWKAVAKWEREQHDSVFKKARALNERAEQLEEALRLAEEHINGLTPDWYSAGQRVLAAIRNVLLNR